MRSHSCGTVTGNGHVLEPLPVARKGVEAKVVETEARERAAGHADHALDRALTVKIFEDLVRFAYEAVAASDIHRPTSGIEPRRGVIATLCWASVKRRGSSRGVACEGKSPFREAREWVSLRRSSMKLRENPVESSLQRKPANRTTSVPNDLSAFWLPFTPNRAFKRAPRFITRAKDMHYFTPDGRAVLDGLAGLWCTNAGHNRDPIVAAIKREAEQLDYAPAFQFAHPKSFELASRVAPWLRPSSTACSSAIQARRRSIPRSRSRSPTTTCVARARARA
jgi:hypothetical protein